MLTTKNNNNILFYSQFYSLDSLTQSIILDTILPKNNKDEAQPKSSWITIDNCCLKNIKHFEYLVFSTKFRFKSCQILDFKYSQLEEVANIIILYFKKTFSSKTDTYYNQFFELNLFKDFNANFDRMIDSQFLLKKLQKLYIVQKEESLRKSKKINSYISNYNSKIFDKNREEQLKKLSKINIVNKNSGEFFNMCDLAIASEKNQINELIFKNYVIEREARKNNFEFLFITITLPSVYHAKKNTEDLKTVKDGHKDLNDFFTNFRINLTKSNLKSGVDYFYLTVNEAHKEGCEHRHIMFFCKKENFDLIKFYINKCYLNKFYSKKSSELQLKITRIKKSHISKEKKEEKIQKLKRDLLDIAIKFVEEDKEKGGASSYIYKYILKTVDEDSDFEERFNDVKKWSRINSIRQYNISCLNLNFSAFKYCMKIFNSINIKYNIEYLYKINNYDSKSIEIIDKLASILSKKITENDDKSTFNYNKLIEFNNFIIENNYIDTKNKFWEDVKKMDFLVINNTLIKSLNNYEKISF